MRSAGFVLAVVSALACQSPAGDPPRERMTEGVGLTIYSSPFTGAQPQQYWNPVRQRWETGLPGYAVVKEWRRMRLATGTNFLRFADVAARIDATTVKFSSLTDPSGTAVLEQNFEYDLVSADKILSRHIGHPVVLELHDGEPIKGTLLSFDAAQIVLEGSPPARAIEIVQRQQNVRNIRFAELPGGLITKPTLFWHVDARTEGDHLVKVAYQTEGIRWNADYTLVATPDEKAVDLSAWVTVTNESGAGYREAELKLVAGDVHRVQPGERPNNARFALGHGASVREPAFEEKPFFEYHLYTLGRPTTLPDNSTKQIELFPPAKGVPARKVLVYYGGVGGFSFGARPFFDRDYGISSNKKVDVYVEILNGEGQGLGLPLPAGRVRVYKMDEADASLEFIGEDRIDHTPKDEVVRLKLGSAFDVVAERRQTDFRVETKQQWMVESFEISIRNHKDEAVRVVVKENLYRWLTWTIEQKSHDFTREDARTIHFPVTVPKNGESKITYTTRYTW